MGVPAQGRVGEETPILSSPQLLVHKVRHAPITRDPPTEFSKCQGWGSREQAEWGESGVSVGSRGAWRVEKGSLKGELGESSSWWREAVEP